MQVELEDLGKLERKLTVKIPSEQMDERVSEQLARMGREVRLKGFRPGRVPRSVIEKRYGAQIRSDVVSELIRSSFGEAVDQKQLEPAAAPTVETDGQPRDGEIAYTATFEVMPELPDVDVAGFTVEKPVAEVSDEDIDAMIETLRKQQRSYTPVERKASEDDMVLFEFEADTSDGHFPEDGRERVGTVLGSGELNADVEAALEGLEAGDTFETEATFAEIFKYEELAGKLGKVAGNVVRVQEEHLPEVDADFFETFGIDDGDEATFRDAVRANLERELQSTMTGRLKGAVADALAEAHQDLELPRVMIENQARALAGADEDKALPEDQLRELEPAARKRVTAGLLLGKIARDQDIEVDDQRVGRALAAIASTYEDPEQLVEVYRNNQELMGALRNQVLEEQVAEWVAENAECVDQPMSFNDLMQPPAQA